MKIKTDWILMLVIVVLAFILLRQCNGSTGTGETVDLTPDTVFVKGKTDTVMFTNVKVVHDTIKSVIINTEIVESAHGIDTVAVYESIIEDSLISAKIVSKVDGVLIANNFSYTPKFPKYITRTDTFKITEPTPVYKEKWGVYVGAEIGGNAEQFRLQPTLLIKTNKKLQFSAGYDLIQKTYNVGAYTKLGWR